MHASRNATSLILSLPLALAIGTCACDANARTPSPDRSPPTRGSFIRVTNCNDSGPGSLRAAVASADSGDYINMRALRCSRVLLTGGAIEIPQDDLTLYGPARELTIDGNHANRVLEHTGTGLLRLRNLSVANGRHEGSEAAGGCIYSQQGDLRLDHVRVHGCELIEADGRAGTGGALMGHEVAVYDSEIFDNSAVGGAGIWAQGHLTLVRSRVHDNIGGSAPGFVADKGLYLRASEISDNYASYAEGGFSVSGGEVVILDSLIADNYSGVWFTAGITGDSILIANTTVSGNETGGNHSGLMMYAPGGISIVNSTVVNNNEEFRTTQRYCAGPINYFGELHLESSIVAGNTCDGQSVDIGPEQLIAGSDNLVRAPRSPMPPDTISADPMLLPLADNGGLTRTHALQPGSPAIDMGNNDAGLEFDQRGPGFPRTQGGRTDIGAYER